MAGAKAPAFRGIGSIASGQTVRKTRILFIGEAITLSHISRPLVLAQTLDPALYEVIFACDHRLRGLLKLPKHCRFVPLTSRMHGTNIDRFTDLRDELYDLPTFEAYIAEDLDLFERYFPDVVVGDMRLSLNISARLADIPYMNIQSCYWHPEARTDLRVPAAPFSASLSARTVNLIANVFAPVATLYPNLLAVKYGLRPPGPDFRKTLCDGDHILFPDIPDWSPLSTVPSNATYVGPLVWAPDVPKPAWWGQIDTARPIIYVSLGSSGQPRLLQMIVEVGVALGFQMIVATAGRTRIEPVPGQVFVADFLDGGAVAKMAVLAICNGGSTAAPQALRAGCPVLGITSNMDQAAFMALLARGKASLELPESSVNQGALRTALTTLTADGSYAAGAKRLSSAIRRISRRNAFTTAIDSCLVSRRKPIAAVRIHNPTGVRAGVS